MRRATRAVLAVCAAGVAALACVNAQSHAATAASTMTGSVTHVVLVMEENHSYSQAMSGMPYLKSLASTYGTATNMWAQHYPSLPNYINLTSGAVPAGIAGKDCTPSSTCEDSGASIFSQGSWNVWAESMPKPCDQANSGEYVPRHTAGPYYTKLAATCSKNDVALPASPVPTAAFTLVAPNLQDDAHNGTLAQANTWLSNFVPKLMATSAYQSGSVLIEITFDSGSNNCGSNCPSQVAAVFINPAISHRVVSVKATHASILRLNEELLNYPLLAGAKTAVDIRAALGL